MVSGIHAGSYNISPAYNRGTTVLFLQEALWPSINFLIFFKLGIHSELREFLWVLETITYVHCLMEVSNHTVVQQIIISLLSTGMWDQSRFACIFNTNGIPSLAHSVYLHFSCILFPFIISLDSILSSQVLLPNYYILHFVLIKI